MSHVRYQESADQRTRAHERTPPPRTATMAHGSGWMHGLVKAVLSGDCVVVMGNAAQVRLPRVRPEPRVASDRSLRSARRSPPICTHPTPPLACVFTHDPPIAMKTDPMSIHPSHRHHRADPRRRRPSPSRRSSLPAWYARAAPEFHRHKGKGHALRLLTTRSQPRAPPRAPSSARVKLPDLTSHPHQPPHATGAEGR